ncbi:hypothetical protein BGX23_004489 [Mortierella sp. AD031]|nr:hypothetical protein BGX23_004489 [Mortierella sp. AD031]
MSSRAIMAAEATTATAAAAVGITTVMTCTTAQEAALFPQVQLLAQAIRFMSATQDLKDLFRTCGPIRMAEMMETAGRSKGSGIVRFDLFESADKAVAKFNGYVYGGRPLEIVYDRV